MTRASSTLASWQIF